MIVDRPIDQFVSGPQGLAGCYDLGRVLLSIDTPIPSRRTVRVDIANQTVSGVGASQHRGRTRPRQHRQLRSTFADRARFAEGVGNASDFGGAGWHSTVAGFAGGSHALRKLGQDGSRLDTIAAGQVSKMTFAIRHSPFAIRSKADLASSPR